MAKEFLLVNRRTKMALQATGLDNGLQVEQAPVNGSDAQIWSSVKAGNGVKLVNKANGKVLDVMAEGVDNGVWLQTWEDVNGESQKWKIEKLTVTYSKIRNIRSGKVLDIVDMSEEEGAPAQIWEDVSGVGQQWKLVPVEQPAKKAAGKKPVAKKAAAELKKAEAKAEKAVKEAKTAVKAGAKKAAAKVKAEAKAAEAEAQKAVQAVEEKAEAVEEKAKSAVKRAPRKTAAKKAGSKTNP